MRRRKLGAKRLDMTQIAAAFADGRQWATLAIVTKQDGTSSHFELATEGDTLVDILVDVETVPDGIDLTCRLAGGSGSQGVWQIPAAGDEVIVVLPTGRVDFMPMIVGIMSGQSISNPSGQGPAAGRTVVCNSEVLVHDGDGGAVSLALKSDVQALKDDLDSHLTEYNAHVHATAGLGTPSPPTVGSVVTPTTPTGTTVLKGK